MLIFFHLTWHLKDHPFICFIGSGHIIISLSTLERRPMHINHCAEWSQWRLFPYAAVSCKFFRSFHSIFIAHWSYKFGAFQHTPIHYLFIHINRSEFLLVCINRIMIYRKETLTNHKVACECNRNYLINEAPLSQTKCKGKRIKGFRKVLFYAVPHMSK